MAVKDNLFDIIKEMFKAPNALDMYTPDVFKRNFFMINRRISIGCPELSQFLNVMGINYRFATKVMNNFLYREYGGRVPGWIYTKGSNKAKTDAATEAKKVRKVTDSMVREFCAHYERDPKDVFLALKVFPDEMTAEILEYFDMVALEKSMANTETEKN